MTESRGRIEGILNEKNANGATAFSGFVSIDGTKYTGESEPAVSKSGTNYHKFVGQDDKGVSLQVAIFMTDNYVRGSDRRTYLSAKTEVKGEKLSIAGWLRQRKDKSGEFVSLSESRPLDKSNAA